MRLYSTLESDDVIDYSLHKSDFLAIKCSPNEPDLPEQLLEFGFRDPIYDTCTVVIQGKRSIRAAINFLRLNKENLQKRYAFDFELDYLDKLEEKCTPKKRINLPKLAENFADYTKLEELQLPKKKSIFIVEHNETHKKYILKLAKHGRQISEIETFIAACYRLLLGKRHPFFKPVYDFNSKELVGSLSEYLEFESIEDIYLRTKTKISKQNVKEWQLIDVYIAAFILGEYDLHNHNYGVWGCKIDPTRSLWDKVTAKYTNINLLFGPRWEKESIPPSSVFPITKSGIRNAPFLVDARPYHSFIRKRFEKGIEEIFEDDEVDNRKWYMFLKAYLIPEEVFIILADISSSSSKKQKLLSQCMIDRTSQLKLLLEMPKFEKYILEHPEAINEIVQEFKEAYQLFNDECNLTDCENGIEVEHTTDTKELINIEKITQKYNKIIQHIKCCQAEVEEIKNQFPADEIIQALITSEKNGLSRYTWQGKLARIKLHITHQLITDSAHLFSFFNTRKYSEDLPGIISYLGMLKDNIKSQAEWHEKYWLWHDVYLSKSSKEEKVEFVVDGIKMVVPKPVEEIGLHINNVLNNPAIDILEARKSFVQIKKIAHEALKNRKENPLNKETEIFCKRIHVTFPEISITEEEHNSSAALDLK